MTMEARVGEVNEGAANWFAVHTIPRHEKRVREQMADRRIETFLPVYHEERQWKKRAPVTLEMPLFPTYLFVRIARQSHGKVLCTPGVLSIVGNGRQPLPVSEPEIETLRTGLQLHAARPHTNLVAGDRVRIKAGPLTGHEGVLIRWRNNYRVVLAMQMIMQSVSIEINPEHLEPANQIPMQSAPRTLTYAM
jgi:transcription antitermination factor NusG